MMYEKFCEYVANRRLIGAGERILVAVSGGIDSMSLLDLMRRAYAGRIGAAHCNFGLRGAESDGDQRLVETYCREHGIPLYVERFDTETEAQEYGESIQMAARRLRYGWFEELCDREGYDRIAIAHHADDSAETFFINLLRGSGLRGLTGIGDRRGRIVRPLLFARRDEVTAYVAEADVPYREDSSNGTLKYLRNRLRHDILPRLESASGNRFGRTMEETLVRLRQTQQFVDLHIERLRERAFVTSREIDLRVLDPACRAFELYELLRPFGFASETVADMVVLLEECEEKEDVTASGKRFEAPLWGAVADRGRLLLVPREVEPFREELLSEDDPRIEWLAMSDLPDSLAGPANVAYLSADALKFPLRLRRWREGDWFIPLGMAGQKKVSDFLVDAKVPVPDKARQGVLVSGETIVWLVGRRIDDRYKVRQDARRVVRITL